MKQFSKILALTISVAVATALPAPALALYSIPTVDANPPSASASVSSCNVAVSDYTPDMQHLTVTVHAYTYPAYATNVVVEVSMFYKDGRPVTWLLKPNESTINYVELTLPRYTVEPESARCAVAFATVGNTEYVAPWLPITYPQEYEQNPRTPIPVVPATEGLK